MYGGKKHFNVGSRFDVYLVQNKPVFKETDIIDEIGEKHQIRLDTLNFLPSYAYDIIFPLLTDEGIDVIHSYSSYLAYKKIIKTSVKQKQKNINIQLFIQLERTEYFVGIQMTIQKDTLVSQK